MSEGLGAPLEVRVRTMGEARVIELSGDLVVTNREAVRGAIEKAIGEESPRVVVDAARLTHIDTASLALLVQLSRTCRDGGGALVVAGLPSAFETLARELRLQEALVFADSVERALDSDGA